MRLPRPYGTILRAHPFAVIMVLSIASRAGGLRIGRVPEAVHATKKRELQKSEL